MFNYLRRLDAGQHPTTTKGEAADTHPVDTARANREILADWLLENELLPAYGWTPAGARSITRALREGRARQIGMFALSYEALLDDLEKIADHEETRRDIKVLIRTVLSETP